MTDQVRAIRTKKADSSAREIVDRDLDALESLAWAGFLSTSQIERLHFPSKRIAQRRLRVLLDLGFVRASLQAGALHLDSIFAITTEGVEKLQATRFAANPDSVRSGRLPRVAKLKHGILIRDAFVELLLAERLGHLTDLDIVFEPTQLAPFAPAGLIPDLFVQYVVRGITRSCAIEVDNCTETTTVLRAKLTKYQAIPVHMVVIADRPGRLTTVSRIIEELGLQTRTTTLLFDGLPNTLASGDLTPYVPPVRSERTGTERDSLENTLPNPQNRVAFRVLDENLV